MLDFEEEALDEVALAIEGIIAGNLRGCFSRRDDGGGVLAVDGVAERLGIVAFVAQDIVGGKVGDQGLGLGEVALLSWRQDEPQRIAQGIDDGMDLGGQSAA